MQRNGLLLIGVIVIILGVIWAVTRTSSAPQIAPPLELAVDTTAEATSTAPEAREEIVPAAPAPSGHPLPIAPGDAIASWDFKGAYVGNEDLTVKAQTAIARFSSELPAATSSKAYLLMSIANEYDLLGKGKEEYEYLGQVIRANPLIGLPWHNLGTLMQRLGAKKTARAAYEKATLVQPAQEQWHYAYLGFLIEVMPTETARIESAFATAQKNIGFDSYLTELRNSWKPS